MKIDATNFFIELIKQQGLKERRERHLTFGDLIEALKNAPSNAVFDKIKGIGAYRGCYNDVALYIKKNGAIVRKIEYDEYCEQNNLHAGDYKSNEKWETEAVKEYK